MSTSTASGRMFVIRISSASEGGPGEQAEDGAGDQERDQRGGERGGLGEDAERGWAAEGTEVADRGDGGDRGGRCGIARARGGAEHGGSDGGEPEAEQRPARDGQCRGGRKDDQRRAGAGGDGAALNDAHA